MAAIFESGKSFLFKFWYVLKNQSVMWCWFQRGHQPSAAAAFVDEPNYVEIHTLSTFFQYQALYKSLLKRLSTKKVQWSIWGTNPNWLRSHPKFISPLSFLSCQFNLSSINHNLCPEFSICMNHHSKWWSESPCHFIVVPFNYYQTNLANIESKLDTHFLSVSGYGHKMTGALCIIHPNKHIQFRFEF